MNLLHLLFYGREVIICQRPYLELFKEAEQLRVGTAPPEQAVDRCFDSIFRTCALRGVACLSGPTRYRLIPKSDGDLRFVLKVLMERGGFDPALPADLRNGGGGVTLRQKQRQGRA